MEGPQDGGAKPWTGMRPYFLGGGVIGLDRRGDLRLKKHGDPYLAFCSWIAGYGMGSLAHKRTYLCPGANL